MTTPQQALLQFPPGSIITLTRGSYSDFCLDSILVTLKQCDLPALAKQFRDEHKPESAYDYAEQRDWSGWLVAKGHCAPVEQTEVHIGDYTSWSEELT